MPTSEHPFLSEPFLAEEIDRAIASVAHLLGPDDIEWLREALATELVEDGELQELLAKAYPRRIDVSGERLVPWLEAQAKRDKARTG